MADWTLPPTDLRILVDIMTRSELFDTPAQRKNFFTYSGYADALPQLSGTIPLTDGTDEFCKTLVRCLMAEGVLPDGSHHGIYLLLRYLLASISGHTTEKLFIEKIMEENEVWARRQQLPSSPTSTPLNLENTYDEAVTHFFDEQWEEVLRLVAILEAHQYDDRHRMTKVADMKRAATMEQAEGKRRGDYSTDYQHIVTLTRKPEWLSLAKQAWEIFQKKHWLEFIDLSPARDPENLSLFFEQRLLLEMMYTFEKSAKERAEAGRKLAKIGDPRPEIMDVDSMPFCWVPAGRFWMGSANKKEDPLIQPDESPAGWFNIAYGYWMGYFPVSNAQYAQFVLETGKANAPKKYSKVFTLPNHPVVGVTWFQCVAFTEWLTNRWESLGYLPRGWKVVLPNEPEWEKAARGGENIVKMYYMTTPEFLSRTYTVGFQTNFLLRRIYPYSNAPDPKCSNYADSKVGWTSAIGCFHWGASPYGCEEMSGNVWEWCRSIWDERYPYTLDRDELTLKGERAARGGAFDSIPTNKRNSFRAFGKPDNQDFNVGFRLAVSPSGR